MNYQSPKGPIESEDRILAKAVALPLIDGENNATLELMKQFPNVAAYGMLLLDDPKHPMAELVRERWSEINNLTGDRFPLFSFERPVEWTQNYVQYWRNKMGDQFETNWKKWQEASDPGTAYTYMSLFKPALTPRDLPCLVLFTDPEERKVAVRPIPNWDEDSLYDLLKGIVTVVQESADRPKEERLVWLAEELTSPGARFRAAAGHAGTKALDYCKQHPAQVASTTISLVLALSGAGLFALPPAAVAIIKVLKDTIPGSKSSAT
jgi:hypothetical protein